MSEAPNYRNSEHEIDPLFLNRWSPRALTGEGIDEASLFKIFEAARWAPSASNLQPWRFIYSRNGSDSWEKFLALLSDNNRLWAQKASTLIVVVSKTTHTPPGKTEAQLAYSHSFDTGAAWASLAFQATLSGWSTHGIGGFDKKAAREVLNIPSDYHIEAAIALGQQGDKSLLPAGLQEKEQPNSRRPLRELIAEGKFAFAV